MANLKRDSA